MVSLAGGIPAPESFPMEIINQLTSRVIEKYSSQAFQYDCTEGFIPLREVLVDYLQKKGISSSADEILIASGSQGILDAIGKVLITKGDRIAVEAPTYLGAISAFNPYEPEYVRMDTDDDDDGVSDADDLSPLDPTITKIDDGGIGDYWWIILILIAVIILALVLMRRKKKDAVPVEEVTEEVPSEEPEPPKPAEPKTVPPQIKESSLSAETDPVKAVDDCLK